MRRKSIPPPPPPKQKPRPRTADERVLTVAEYFAAKSRTQKEELLPMIRIRGQWLKKKGHPGIEWITRAETAYGKAEKASRPHRRLSRFPTRSAAVSGPVRSTGE